MKRLILALVILVGWTSIVWAEPLAPLPTLRAIHALSNAEVDKHPPVAFEATVTYIDTNVSMLIVQDGGLGIYLRIPANTQVNMGDRVLVRGKLTRGFLPSIVADTVTFLHKGTLPQAVPATFDDLIRVQRDCMRIRIHAVIQAADPAWGPNGPTFLQLRTDKGLIDAYLNSNDANARKALLDAEADVTGIATTKLDGKGQETGVLLLVPSLDDIKILRRSEASSQPLPLTSINGMAAAFQVNDFTHRVHVRGTITYYQPGSNAVLQSGNQSFWIQTQSNAPLRIGDLADATGFPTLYEGFLALARGVIQDSNQSAPVTPEPLTWEQLAASSHIFDLVSIEGKVVTRIREASQDEYVLNSGSNLFTAIYRHPTGISLQQLAPMKMVPVGAKVRVTGICMLKDSNPYNGPVPFDILLRSFDDITVVAKPSPLNIQNLIIVLSLMLLVVIIVGIWGWTLNTKVRRQTGTLATMAQFEQRRSRILEDINGSKPLAEILEEIAEMASFMLHGAPCWCEVMNGARLGKHPRDAEHLRVLSAKIPAYSGPAIGTIFAALDPKTPPDTAENNALSTGAKLASLAMETRRLNSDLRHRSEFDLLTDICNRFSLGTHLNHQIQEAQHHAGIFGLIYIDLDKFKQVNDIYGHHIGDLYLQVVVQRMKQQLRAHDLLARLGGDEFAVLLPMVHNRADVEEIVQRLGHCFEAPFDIEGHLLHGSASIGFALYPEDSTTRDGLLNAADAAMYAIKASKH
jgi:diguanylate cyclase (GGDEF)-like protein